MSAPVLTKVEPGVYRSLVRPRGAGGEPFNIYVRGQFRELRSQRQWVVESDDERFFLTLSEARTYLACFFEAA
jgi:hypothetical protein